MGKIEEFVMDAYGGEAPYQKKSDTSKKAAEEIKPYRVTGCDKVIRALGDNLPITMEKISMEEDMRLQTVCARVNELKQAGFVEDKGLRGKTESGRSAVRWCLTPEGVKYWVDLVKKGVA